MILNSKSLWEQARLGARAEPDSEMSPKHETVGFPPLLYYYFFSLFTLLLPVNYNFGL